MRKSFEEMTRSERLKVIYRHTHRDFKGSVDGVKSILVLQEGATTLVPLAALTDGEIDRLFPPYQR